MRKKEVWDAFTEVTHDIRHRNSTISLSLACFALPLRSSQQQSRVITVRMRKDAGSCWTASPRATWQIASFTILLDMVTNNLTSKNLFSPCKLRMSNLDVNEPLHFSSLSHQSILQEFLLFLPLTNQHYLSAALKISANENKAVKF